jgi:hypothetical protein
LYDVFYLLPLAEYLLDYGKRHFAMPVKEHPESLYAAVLKASNQNRVVDSEVLRLPVTALVIALTRKQPKPATFPVR